MRRKQQDERLPYQNKDMAWPVLVDPLYPTVPQQHAIVLATGATKDQTIHPNWFKPGLWELVAEELAKLNLRRERQHERQSHP